MIWESAAIMSHLVDAHREVPMAPVAGTREGAKHDVFLVAAHTDLEEPLWTIAKHKFVYPEHLRSEAAVAAARFDWSHKTKVLDSLVPKNNFLFGSQLTAADIALAYVFNWAKKIELIEDFELLQQYFLRCRQRPCSTLG